MRQPTTETRVFGQPQSIHNFNLYKTWTTSLDGCKRRTFRHFDLKFALNKIVCQTFTT